jgi:DNA-cytosine methyltransferase
MSNKVIPQINPKIIDKFRTFFERKISTLCKEDRVCILLSGGIDSTLMGLVSHHIGKKVVGVSYQIEKEENIDCVRSSNTSEIMGWEFHRVVVPTDKIEDWFFHLIYEQKCEKKTVLEILYPFIHMMNKVKELGFNKVITGFTNPLPDGRNSIIDGRNDWIKYLRDIEDDGSPTDGTKKCIEYGKSIGVEVLSPFCDRELFELCELITFDQVHHPYEKTPWKQIYENDVKNIGLMDVKKISLQKGNGLQNKFPKVLKNPKINKPNYSKGNNIIRLGSLIKWWSKQPKNKIPKYINLNPQIKEGNQPPIIKFEPYTLKDVKKESDKELFSVVTTFSGGGGSSTGYKLGGGKILLMNEFIPEGVNTYLQNYPNTPYEMVDIRKITRRGGRDYVVDFFKSKGIEVGGFDILDGSPPCSTFSTSGKGISKNEQKNVKYSDTTQDRIGMLIHDFVYINNVMKPKVCIIENVPSIQSSDVFQYSLDRLRRWGYLVNYSTMCSSNFGVPQRRRRLIVIGIRPDICKNIGLKDEEEILDLYPEGSSYEPTIKDGLNGVDINEFERKQLLLNCIKQSSYELIKSIPKDPQTIRGMGSVREGWTSDFNLLRTSMYQPSPTLTQMGQQMGRGGCFHPLEDRVFTVNELKRLMGLPDDYILTGTFNQKSERCGRMVTPPIYKYLSKSIYENVLKPSKDVIWEDPL